MGRRHRSGMPQPPHQRPAPPAHWTGHAPGAVHLAPAFPSACPSPSPAPPVPSCPAAREARLRRCANAPGLTAAAHPPDREMVVWGHCCLCLWGPLSDALVGGLARPAAPVGVRDAVGLVGRGHRGRWGAAGSAQAANSARAGPRGLQPPLEDSACG